MKFLSELDNGGNAERPRQMNNFSRLATNDDKSWNGDCLQKELYWKKYQDMKEPAKNLVQWNYCWWGNHMPLTLLKQWQLRTVHHFQSTFLKVLLVFLVTFCISNIFSVYFIVYIPEYFVLEFEVPMPCYCNRIHHLMQSVHHEHLIPVSCLHIPRNIRKLSLLKKN